MLFVSEAAAKRLVTMAEAIDVVEKVFTSLERGDSVVFPVTRGQAAQPGAGFGVKSGAVHDQGLIGAKIGTYWPGNRDKGLEAHGSTTFFLEPDTGYPRAVVSASHLTALRTAAADGVAVKYLSRPDASVVGIIGPGHQAWYELLAVREVRPITKVLVWSRTAEHAETFAAQIRDELGLEAHTGDAETVSRGADIIITATAARQALVMRDWVRPGTHVSAMGADGPGKQELDPALVAAGSRFTDVVSQSITLGEFEAAALAGLIKAEDIATIGSVILGAPGRTSDDEITIFDSSGIAIQDLAIGDFALRKAIAAGQAQEMSAA
jgi:alanine dehydrogenase